MSCPMLSTHIAGDLQGGIPLGNPQKAGGGPGCFSISDDRQVMEQGFPYLLGLRKALWILAVANVCWEPLQRNPPLHMSPSLSTSPSP